MRKITVVLSLDKETLRNLDAQELSAVKGAEPPGEPPVGDGQSAISICYPRPPI